MAKDSNGARLIEPDERCHIDRNKLTKVLDAEIEALEGTLSPVGEVSGRELINCVKRVKEAILNSLT